jgi:uncharacterized Rmd1/YagE family protein
LDLPGLLADFQSQEITSSLHQISGAVHRSFDADLGDVFYFPYGTVVMWGLSEEEERQVRSHLRGFEKEPVDSPDFEEYRYAIGPAAKITRSDIALPSDNILTKLAMSHGLAQSVKLGVFEKRIEQRIESTRYIPESLIVKGRIPLRRRAITRMMGQLFIDRSLVNLHSNILDTPEFFWEYSDFEPLYRLISQDLDIANRVNVLNKRMDILRDLFEMLGNELDSRHSVSIEIIIVLLIAVELVLGLTKHF